MKRTPVWLGKRLDYWQDRMVPFGIAHFRVRELIICEETPGGPNSSASVQVSSDYDSCTFWFRADYLENATDRDLDETIIHEWLHVAWRDMDELIASLEVHFSDAQWTDLTSRIDHEREGIVERTARGLYDRHRALS